MEFEEINFNGIHPYFPRVSRPKQYPNTAIINLNEDGLGIPDNPYLRPNGKFGEAIAYLCGTGIRRFVFDLRTLRPNCTTITATAIAIMMRNYSVTTRFLGLDTTQTPSSLYPETKRHIEDWQSTIKNMSTPSLEAVVTEGL